jgi:hypothetical protein
MRFSTNDAVVTAAFLETRIAHGQRRSAGMRFSTKDAVVTAAIVENRIACAHALAHALPDARAARTERGRGAERLCALGALCEAFEFVAVGVPVEVVGDVGVA